MCLLGVTTDSVCNWSTNPNPESTQTFMSLFAIKEYSSKAFSECGYISHYTYRRKKNKKVQMSRV